MDLSKKSIDRYGLVDHSLESLQQLVNVMPVNNHPSTSVAAIAADHLASAAAVVAAGVSQAPKFEPMPPMVLMRPLPTALSPRIFSANGELIVSAYIAEMRPFLNFQMQWCEGDMIRRQGLEREEMLKLCTCVQYSAHILRGILLSSHEVRQYIDAAFTAMFKEYENTLKVITKYLHPPNGKRRHIYYYCDVQPVILAHTNLLDKMERFILDNAALLGPQRRLVCP